MIINRLQFLRHKHRGFSLLESLILILVVSMVIAGLLNVSAYTTRMQLAGRQHIDSYLMASSWFSALESVGDIQNNFEAAAAQADAIIDADSTGKLAKTTTFIVITNRSSNVDGGVLTVSIDITEGGTTKRTLSRKYNIYGNETVSDDKVVKL